MTRQFALRVVRGLLVAVGLALLVQTALLLRLHGTSSDPRTHNVTPASTRQAVTNNTKPCLEKTVIGAGVEDLVGQVASQDNWRWIVSRIRNTWSDWFHAAQDMEERGQLAAMRRKRVLVVPGLLMVTDFGERAGSGGPLGDLVQWADLIAALHVLGHNVTLMTDIYQATRGLRYDKFLWSPRPGCPATGFSHVFTDIVTLKAFPHEVIAPKHFKCQFRVLDAYGTEAMYNHPKYSHKHGTVSATYGGLGLDLRQFFTFYPHTVDNSFLGFAAHEAAATHGNLTVYRDPHRALVYGKHPGYFKGREAYLETLMGLGLTLHTTVQNSSMLPPGMVSHGVLSSQQYRQLMMQAKYFVGLGEPLESTGVVEALAAGCIFINPRFTGNQTRILQTMGKPTSRKMTSQVPYLEGKRQVITVDISNVTLIKQAIEKASTLQNKPSMPDDFTARAFLARVAAVVDNLDLCSSDADPWPSPDLLQTSLGDAGETCTDACLRNGMSCENSYFNHVNSYQYFERHGLVCNKTSDLPGLLYPAYLTEKHTCTLQRDTGLFSCAGSNTHVRRLCPCRADAL